MVHEGFECHSQTTSLIRAFVLHRAEHAVAGTSAGGQNKVAQRRARGADVLS